MQFFVTMGTTELLIIIGKSFVLDVYGLLNPIPGYAL